MLSRKISVLIVDDEKYIREGLQALLEWETMDFSVCDEAGTGEEALEKIFLYQPDLVLMDINMPVMDGYEALRGVREISPDVPVIALTAYAFETDRYRMFQAGFNECLAKPLRADELRTRIAALLSR